MIISQLRAGSYGIQGGSKITPLKKITSILLAGSLLTLVLLVSYLGYSLRESSVKQWVEYRSGSVSHLANLIDDELFQAQERLEYVSNLAAFKAALDTSFIDKNLNGIPLGVDTNRRQALDWILAEADHGFSVIFVLLPNGDHYLSHPYTVQKNLKTYNLSHRPYFKEAQKTLKPVLSNTFLGADGIPAVAIDIPILDEQGKLISHLGGVFHLSRFQELLDNSGFDGSTDTVFLLDYPGSLICKSGTTNYDLENINAVLLASESLSHQEMGTHMDIITLPMDDGEQIMMLSHMRCHWTLGVVSLKEMVVSQFEPDIWRTAALAGVLLLLLSSISLFFANRIGLDWQADDRKRQAVYVNTEAALSERENIFKSITNQSSEGITVADTDGNYTFVNPAFCKMIGYSAEELLQMTVFDVKSKSQDTSTFDKSKTSKEGLPITVFLQRKDGSEFFSEVVGKIIEVGGEPAVLGTIRDITDRLAHEEERLSLERQIQHAQKLESLGILAGGIAHDFNNLLMAILGNADLAQTKLSPLSPAREYLLEIEKASRRAADLAQQMLAYSGKGRFVIQPINLGELVQEMAHLLEVSISKKIQLQYNFPPSLPSFDGDITQIRQVIMNLITNASEAIGDKVGVISLSSGIVHCDHKYLHNIHNILNTGNDDSYPEGDYAYLEVRDSGCGMDDETLERIFDPFFTTKFTGRGLGMSAVQGIVRGHKGIIQVESNTDEGTIFKVLFPASSLVENTQIQIPSEHSSVQATANKVFSGTVLIADDELAVRTVGRKMLELLGFDVLTAEDGSQAVKIFRQQADSISCVLLDLTMPNMDGREAFREIRALRPEVTVVLCSGFNELDATQHFEGLGLAGFIQKPFKIRALQNKLEEVLKPGK